MFICCTYCQDIRFRLHGILIKNLSLFDINGNLIHCITKWLIDRSQSTVANEKVSVSRAVSTGGLWIFNSALNI